MARPVAIIRSSDLTMVNSPPTPPANSISSPHPDHSDHVGQNDINQSPPDSPQAQMERKGLSRIASPYAPSRDYAFNHFHSQQTQVCWDFFKDWNSKSYRVAVMINNNGLFPFPAFQLPIINLNDVWSH